MTRNVEAIRQAITKVTQMLSGMSITVTQRGDQALVEYDARTGKARRVNIPFLPDGASDQLIAAVQGFLDHEVAHILFTDAKAGVEAYKESKRLGIMQNIVEDCFIERLMTKRFKGSGMNLGNVRKLVFDTRKRPVIDDMIAKGQTEELVMFKALSTAMFRALAGQVECKEFLDDGDKWQYMPNVVKALSFFEHDIKKCKSSWDTLALARKTLEALKNMQKDEDEKEDDKDDKDDEPDDEGDGEDSDGDESKDSKQGKSKDGDQTESDDDEDDGESDEDDGESDEDDKSEKDSDGDDESDKSEDESDKSEDEGDEEGEDEADGDEDTAEDGDDSDSGSDTSGDDDNDTEGTEEGELMLEALEDAQDFESDLSQEVTSVYQDQSESGQFGEWLIFSREYDTPEIYDAKDVSEQAVPHMTNEVNSMVGPMAKQLERLILARKKSLFEPGKRAGRLHAANLHRLTTGDDRIFRKRYETRIKDTAVEILVDMSGSMGGEKMTVAAHSSYALAQMLQRVNIPSEVMAFSTSEGDSKFNEEMFQAMQRLGREFSHLGVCKHLLLKTFNERIDSGVAKRFAHLGENGSRYLMRANCDPESVYAAATRLARRPEERKVLMVLSDGHPAYAGDYNSGFDRLREVVKDIERTGTDVIGIGIMDDSVRSFYSKAVVINSARDLPKTIMGEMQELLLR